jgi:glycosyltransferase involved in cell wall biosynthesis
MTALQSQQSRVLIDMSPLDTPSRLRGIGQYIMGLALGIQKLQAAGALELNVDGIAQFDVRGKSTGPDGLSYPGKMVHPQGFANGPYRRRKRYGLGPAAFGRGCDLLHITEPVVIPRDNRIPRIVTCYDLIPLVLHKEYLGPEPWARIYCKWKDSQRYGTARRILAISQATRSDLVRHLGISESLIDVAYLGVDRAQFHPEPEFENEQSSLVERYSLKRQFCYYVGAFDSRKNIDILINSFAQAGLAKDFDLVLAGAIMDKRKRQLQQLANKANVASAVRLLGYVDQKDIAAFYRACHVHVFPSKYEGFGLPVAEAMACGAPTVTTNATSIPEITGNSAVLVPPSDPVALAEALRSLCLDDVQRAQLRQRGPLEVARFTWVECARQTVEAYRKALSS